MLEGKGVPLGAWEVACARGNLVPSSEEEYTEICIKNLEQEGYNMCSDWCRPPWLSHWAGLTPESGPGLASEGVASKRGAVVPYVSRATSRGYTRSVARKCLSRI